MKSLLYLTFFLGMASAANAQDSTISLRRTYHTIVKFSPLSLLDQDATVQGGLEYRTGVRTSLQGEFGYGRKGLSLLDSDLDNFVNAEVWRGRAEVRFYNNRYRANRRQNITIRSEFPLGNYWAIDGLLKQVNVTSREYTYQPIYSSAAPRHIGLTNTSRYVVGSHLKFGRQFALYDPHKRHFTRTLVDIYVGAGVRWAINDIWPTNQNLFSTCSCGKGRSFIKQGSHWAPSISAGLKLGLAL